MPLSRRDFLKLSGATGAAVAWGTFGFDLQPAYAQVRTLKTSRATEVRSVCPYCAVGCSMIAYVTGQVGGKNKPTLVHIEGDPDSPINEGTLCPKGASTMQLALGGNLDRATTPQYRAPGSDEWQQLSWDETLDRLARLVKDTRDETFTETDDDGNTVNRQTGFAFTGGATQSNEEGQIAVKVMRSLGTVYIEQQARV
jgi:formate dehydrogenase major subunit